MNKENWWRNRKIDWEKSYWTPRHPHRILILREMLRFVFKSVFEIGCGAGVNLANIYNVFRGVEVGGTDVNPDAIALAKKMVPYAKDLEIGTTDDIFFSDKSIDLIIADAVLLYVDRKKIHKTIKELARVVRNGVVFCEPYDPRWWKRIWVGNKEKMYLHNYPKLLEKYGFYDVKVTKIEKQFWDDSLWYTYGYIISAKI